MMRILLLCWSLAPLLWQLRTSFLVGDVLVGEQSHPGLSPWTLANYRLVLHGDPSLTQVLLNTVGNRAAPTRPAWIDRCRCPLRAWSP